MSVTRPYEYERFYDQREDCYNQGLVDHMRPGAVVPVRDPREVEFRPPAVDPALRDQFAMAALTGLLAAGRTSSWGDTASMAYCAADAMMNARST